MGILDNELINRLKKTCESYLRHTIEHLILQRDDYDNLLQIVINIQGALEAVIKLFIVKNKGYKEITIFKKHQYTYTEVQLLDDLNNGLLKFCNYEELIEKVNLSPTKESCINNLNDEFFEFDNEIKNIIKEFEKQRNQLIHIGLQSIKTESFYNAIRLIISIFTHFYYEANSLYGSFNYLEELLGSELFGKFVSLTGVKQEIETIALNKYDKKELKYCFGCGFLSMYPKHFDYYKCLFCGCEILEEFIYSENCPSCGKKEIIYDSLNIQDNLYVNGRCSYCKKIFKISRCNNCNKDVYYLHNGICPKCKKTII